MLSIYNIALIVLIVLLVLSFMNNTVPSLVRIILSILVVGLLIRLAMTVFSAV